MISYHIYESCPFLSVLIAIDMHLSEKSGSIIFWEIFFLIFVTFIVSLFTQLTQRRLILCLWGGEGWKCNYKNTIFQACSGIVCECRIFSTFWVTTFPVTPCLDFLFVIKHYFSSAWDNLNKRPSHQVRVGPNWNWMLFSKLPYLLDAIWPIIATPDHFPVFRN